MFAPPRLDWGEQIVVITGGSSLAYILLLDINNIVGSSGVGELLANTLAVQNVNVVVLDVNPIATDNCKLSVLSSMTNGLKCNLSRQHHVLPV